MSYAELDVMEIPPPPRCNQWYQRKKGHACSQKGYKGYTRKKGMHAAKIETIDTEKKGT